MTEGTVTVRIEDTYEDGHEAVHEHELEAPVDIDDEDEDWWQETVFPHTGDGHGTKHPKLGVWHEAEIIAGPEDLIGRTWDWG